jgi:hypothetical protein
MIGMLHDMAQYKHPPLCVEKGSVIVETVADETHSVKIICNIWCAPMRKRRVHSYTYGNTFFPLELNTLDDALRHINWQLQRNWVQ